MQACLSELEQAPTGLYTLTSLDPSLREAGFEPGAIFCLHNQQGGPANKAQVDDNYAIALHFLVYVAEVGEVKAPFTRPKQILNVHKKQTVSLARPDASAVTEFNRRTGQGTNMQALQNLLATAIDSIVGKY